MFALKLAALLVCYVGVCEAAGNYTIGFEKFGSATNSTQSKPRPGNSFQTPPPRPNPTYRPSPPKVYPTMPPPTYRPKPNPPPLNPTYPSRPNPTYRPAPPKPNPTYWPPKTNPAPSRTTTRTTKRTTPKPIPQQNPTPPPVWNIWSTQHAQNQLATTPPGKVPTNNFKSDPNLLGLYTLIRSVVGVTLSQNGQAKPTKKALRLSYPYYYAVYHYNQNREKVSNKILVPYDSVGYCDAGTSDRTCVPGTYALCLLDWTVMCITYSTATQPCYFNTSLQCATGKVPCNRLDPVCSSMGNHVDVQTPCLANVTVTSPNAIKGTIIQNSGPDPYASVVSGPIELCATTVLELKRLESPVGAIVGFLSELQKFNLDFVNNFNSSKYVTITTLPPVSPGPAAVLPVNLPPAYTPPVTIQP